MGRASKDKRDIYYRKAKEEGFRARSAYKLLQIDEEFNILNDVTRAVDLCAAPGSWSQVLASRLLPSTSSESTKEVSTRFSQPSIVAVDLQEMAPIPGVTILQGDITTERTASEIVRLLGNAKAELVVCDGAPDVTGLHELDEYLQHQLLLAALAITTFVLETKGTFVAKIFRGPNTGFLCSKFQIFFNFVTIVKPKSSRNASMESFILCQNYRPPEGYVPTMINPLSGVPTSTALPVRDVDHLENTHDSNQCLPVQLRVVRFLACGDMNGATFFDSDHCYDREEDAEVLPPVAPPINTPYMKAVQDAKQSHEPKRPRSE